MTPEERAEKVFFGRGVVHTSHCESANNCCAEDCFCGAQDDYEDWRKACGRDK